eukprot:2936176-Prorocentrum_lima.AAC.1
MTSSLVGSEMCIRDRHCSQCTRSFRSKAALRGHERLSHQAPHLIARLDADKVCPYCAATFWDPSRLKRHLLQSGRLS